MVMITCVMIIYNMVNWSMSSEVGLIFPKDSCEYFDTEYTINCIFFTLPFAF